MGFFRVYNLNQNSFKDIEYKCGNEKIESLLYEYDPNLNPDNTRLSIGDDLFVKWNQSIDSCLHYGSSIQIYTFLIHIQVHFKNQSLRIEVDSRQSILSLKALIKKHFDILVVDQILTFNETIIYDNIESLIFYKINENSSVWVSLKLPKADINDSGKKVLIKYCGKPTGITLLIDKSDDLFSIREKISDSDINPDKYQIRLNDKMLDHLRQTRQGKQYYSLKIDDMDSIDLYPKHVTTNAPISLLRKPKTFECNKDAPEWQIIKPGLCLKGQCTKKGCIAHNSLVIMNLATPTIYRFGADYDERTCCPICKNFVEPKSLCFNNCEWRFIAIKKDEKGELIRIKSEWKFANHTNFHHLNEDDLLEWDSLVFETKDRHDYLTNKIKCKKCLSFHEPITNDDTEDNICRHEFYAPYMFTKNHEKNYKDFSVYNLTK